MQQSKLKGEKTSLVIIYYLFHTQKVSQSASSGHCGSGNIQQLSLHFEVTKNGITPFSN